MAGFLHVQNSLAGDIRPLVFMLGIDSFLQLCTSYMLSTPQDSSRQISASRNLGPCLLFPHARISALLCKSCENDRRLFRNEDGASAEKGSPETPADLNRNIPRKDMRERTPREAGECLVGAVSVYSLAEGPDYGGA